MAAVLQVCLLVLAATAVQSRYPANCSHSGFYKLKQRVWDKASVSNQLEPAKYRLDVCGAVLAWEAYGSQHSTTGWQIDLRHGCAVGGTKEFANLQPLQWAINNAKGAVEKEWKRLDKMQAVPEQIYCHSAKAASIVAQAPAIIAQLIADSHNTSSLPSIFRALPEPLGRALRGWVTKDSSRPVDHRAAGAKGALSTMLRRAAHSLLTSGNAAAPDHPYDVI